MAWELGYGGSYSNLLNHRKGAMIPQNNFREQRDEKTLRVSSGVRLASPTGERWLVIKNPNSVIQRRAQARLFALHAEKISRGS